MLDTLKSYLDITWEDEHTDGKLTAIIERGRAYLDRIAGAELDYDDDYYKSLLLDYCRYAWGNASEDFAENYAGDLLMLRATRQASEVELDED